MMSLVRNYTLSSYTDRISIFCDFIQVIFEKSKARASVISSGFYRFGWRKLNNSIFNHLLLKNLG